MKPDELLERAMTSAAPIGMFTETVSPEKATLAVALMPTPSTAVMTKKHRPRTQRQPGAVASASKVPANGKTRRAGGEKTTKKKGGKQLARAAKAQAAERQAPDAGRLSPMSPSPMSPSDRAPMSPSRAMASPVAARGRTPQREMSRARVIATASSDDEHSSDGEDDEEEPPRMYLTLAASPPPPRLASPPLGHEASLLVAHMWALSAMQTQAWEGGGSSQWASSVPRRPPRRARSASRSSVNGTVNGTVNAGPASPTAPSAIVLDTSLDLSVASGWRIRDLSAEANTPSSVASAATSSWTKASSCDETLLSPTQRLAYEEAELHYTTFLSPRDVREPLGTALGEPPLMPTMPGTAPPMPGTAPPMPGTAPPMPGTAPPMPGTAPPMPGTAPPMPGSSLAATATAAAAVRATVSATVSAPSAPSAAAAPASVSPPLRSIHSSIHSPPLRSLLKREGSKTPNLSAVMSAQGGAEARMEVGSVGASERSSAKSRVSFSEHLTDRSSPRPPPVRLAHYTPPPLAPPAGPPAPRLPLPEGGPSFPAQHLLVQRAMLALQGAPISYFRNGWSLPADGRLQRGGVPSGVGSSAGSSVASFASQLSHAASMDSSQSSLHPSDWTTTWNTTPMRPGAPPPPVVAHENTLHGLNGATTTIPLRVLPGNLLPGALASSLGAGVGGLGTRPKAPNMAPQIANGPLPIRGPPVVGLGVAPTRGSCAQHGAPSEMPRHGAAPAPPIAGEASGLGRPPQVPQRHPPPF
jgi:hypothetical protein